jgi:hypothetical protein
LCWLSPAIRQGDLCGKTGRKSWISGVFSIPKVIPEQENPPGVLVRCECLGIGNSPYRGRRGDRHGKATVSPAPGR